MHKRSLRRFAVVTGAALITGATAVPAMASLSIGSSSGLLSESGIANDLVPTALPNTGPAVTPILPGGIKDLLPQGVASVPSILPANILGLTGTSLLTTATLVVLPTAIGAAGPALALPTTALGLVTGPTSPVNTVVATVIGSLGVLNPSSGAIGGVLGSM